MQYRVDGISRTDKYTPYIFDTLVGVIGGFIALSWAALRVCCTPYSRFKQQTSMLKSFYTMDSEMAQNADDPEQSNKFGIKDKL